VNLGLDLGLGLVSWEVNFTSTLCQRCDETPHRAHRTTSRRER